MDRANLRAAAGFVLAPWSPPLLLSAIAVVRDVDTHPMWGFPITLAYIWIALIAVPAYRLFTKHAAFRFHHALGVWALVGFMVWATFPLVPVFECVGLGIFAGVTFWLIWYRRSDGRART